MPNIFFDQFFFALFALFAFFAFFAPLRWAVCLCPHMHHD